jgi:ROS/MUCR transcriptional regulator protein
MGVNDPNLLNVDLLDLQNDPRLAVRQESVVCLLCGGSYRQLTNTHLASHGMTSASYKARFGYNRRRPLQCLALQQVYRQRAIATGLAARIRTRPIVIQPELRRLGGVRPVTYEERLNRSEAQRVAAASRRAAAPSVLARTAVQLQESLHSNGASSSFNAVAR